MLNLHIFAYPMSQTGKKICIYIVDKTKIKINGGLRIVGTPSVKPVSMTNTSTHKKQTAYVQI